MSSFRKADRPILAILGRATLALAAAAVIVAPSNAQFIQNSQRQVDDPYSFANPLGAQSRDSRNTARDAADVQSGLGSDSSSSNRSGSGYRPVEIEGGDSDMRGPTTRAYDSIDRRGLTTQNDEEDITGRSSTMRPPRYEPSEFETFVSTLADKPLRRFGAELLVPGARRFTVPPTTTVPPDYRLNPGDELILGITGSVEASSLRLVLNSEGRIFVPRAGPVNLAGVRYADAQAAITRQLSRYYRDFQVDVTVGRLHGITVYVTGFALRPGSYTVSSLSTLVNAVLAAGGPSSGGSFRSIQLRRQGQLVSDFDLYDLLLKGDKSGDSILQNGDVVYITPAGAQAAVIGSVNHEAIFEAGPTDTLADLVLFAGGLNTVADNMRLMVLDPVRRDSAGWEELSADQVSRRKAQRGEVVRVLSSVGIARPLAQQPVLVTISGEVAKPGRYYFQPGASVSDLLERAGGLTGQAFPFASVMTRESVLRQQRTSYSRAIDDMELLLTTDPLISADRGERLQATALQALQGLVQQLREREPDGRIVLDMPIDARGLPGDMVLENNDTVYIPPPPVTIGVFGAVPNAASFRYQEGGTIGDYLRKAGGVQKIGDRSGIFVVRASGSVIGGRKGAFRSGVLSQPAYPGDLIYVPIDAGRGEFWARLRDITSVLFSGVGAAASIKVLSE
jgi:polysaccharide biosynthesis/export protein